MLVSNIHPKILHPDHTVLVVIDMQETLLRTIYQTETIQHNVRLLIQGALTLRVPILCTTQNAEKLGDMAPDIKNLLPPLLPVFNKMTFSCFSARAFSSELQRTGRKQILLCGVETHICVCQTALELIASGFQTHIVTDATSARTEANWGVGLEKMRQNGVLISSVEMALFEMLREAGTPEFRAILKLVK